ncbi:Mitochondrial import inner membrane translocase subunit tim22 [Nowakowskiella sp. JEL0078]|nr:Mitochondrial import inner membrane translocase subunit tim22 [Nowakowskiella sp. JEL0078]
MPAPSEQMIQQMQMAQMQALMESCPVKVAMAGVGGFAIGGLIGMFMSSLETHAMNEDYLKMKFKDQVKFTFKDLGARALSSGKNFGKIGAIYSGSECIIESYRAKTDLYNSAVAGCVTGGILAANAGPQAMVMGCGSFAAFSIILEQKALQQITEKQQDFKNKITLNTFENRNTLKKL